MAKKGKFKINNYRYPANDKLTARNSTICRSMANTLLRRDACTVDDEEKWLSFFPNNTCAYCGREATHLDHLYPLINGRKPTGYGTEPANLVPCCHKCNQLKGNTNWEEFIEDDTKCQHVNQPDSSNTKEQRIETLRKFQEEMPAHIDELSDETIAIWNDILDTFDNALREAKEKLEKMKSEIYK